jgi:hypothetical protein
LPAHCYQGQQACGDLQTGTVTTGKASLVNVESENCKNTEAVTVRSCQLKCFYTNADSLKSVELTELKTRIIDSAGIYMSDIIAVTEVNSKPTNDEVCGCELQIPGFRLFRNASEVENRDAAMYVNNRYTITQVKTDTV